MNTPRPLHLALCAALLLLCACGPKNIGEDRMPEPDDHVAMGNAQELRYPTDGNRVQQRLYLFNHPTAAIQRMELQRAQMLRRMDPDAPNDYTNLQPRQASPFRQ